MKTAGWILIVIGALAFLGAASKGHSVFGPFVLDWDRWCITLSEKEKGEKNQRENYCRDYTSKKTREASKLRE